jgi:hypothetical protein
MFVVIVRKTLISNGYPSIALRTNVFMKTPERTTPQVFPRYVGGELLADSAPLKWPGLFVRRYRYPRCRTASGNAWGQSFTYDLERNQ